MLRASPGARTGLGAVGPHRGGPRDAPARPAWTRAARSSQTAAAPRARAWTASSRRSALPGHDRRGAAADRRRAARRSPLRSSATTRPGTPEHRGLRPGRGLVRRPRRPGRRARPDRHERGGADPPDRRRDRRAGGHRGAASSAQIGPQHAAGRRHRGRRQQDRRAPSPPGSTCWRRSPRGCARASPPSRPAATTSPRGPAATTSRRDADRPGASTASPPGTARDSPATRPPSGEIFDPNKLTAASPWLPFNTILRVTEHRHREAVTVRVNDRGPFGRGVLDLSAARRPDHRPRGLAAGADRDRLAAHVARWTAARPWPAPVLVGRRDEALGDVRRHLLVAQEAHRVVAAAAGHRVQIRARRPAPRPSAPRRGWWSRPRRDPSRARGRAVPVMSPITSPTISSGTVMSSLMIGSSSIGSASANAFLNAIEPGDLERHLRRVDRVVGAVVRA